ncbi:hypothetical protein DNHGIG_39120 [Collibacillus ludicampi]|jgi:hypothetical protein|uniref:Uncharacterized protein n=1 Tax=Collibacillus ludicampi TaxID=2771369 RepID=A0AAV4LKR0_9BACL|nr:hypothetical protein [Collibacillus ludicampi]GIM48363.1 hypothetical protein DNHGIG_39120 [Collibacillus ludicampi]
MNVIPEYARKRQVERRIENPFSGQNLRIEEFMDRLRREVELAREADPSLESYHLHDLSFQFRDRAIILHMDFRL